MKAGWEKRALGELCEIYQPKTISKKEMMEDGEFPVFGANGVIGRYHMYNHELSEVLVTCRGATCGSVNISSPRSWITGNAMVVRPKNGELIQSFLAYAFKGIVDFSKVISGAAQPQITRASLAPVLIPVPPIAEQKQIVSLLDQAFTGIERAAEAARKNCDNARELFETTLNATFTQKGEGWVETTLGEVCELISGQHIDAKDYNVEKSGIGYLTGPADFNEMYPSVSKWTNSPKRTALLGDILITVKGSGVGKINLMDAPELAISRQLMAVRPVKASLEYIYWFLSQRFKYFQGLANGAAIPGISRGDVLGLEISMPTLSGQEAVVAIVQELHSQTQRLEALYQQKLDALEELKQSLLQKAFAGELTTDFNADQRDVNTSDKAAADLVS